MQSRRTKHRRSPAQEVTVAQIPEARLKIQTVQQLTATSASTIRRMVAAGTFPPPVRYGSRCTRWIAGDVMDWLRSARGA